MGPIRHLHQSRSAFASPVVTNFPVRLVGGGNALTVLGVEQDLGIPGDVEVGYRTVSAVTVMIELLAVLSPGLASVRSSSQNILGNGEPRGVLVHHNGPP